MASTRPYQPITTFNFKVNLRVPTKGGGGSKKSSGEDKKTHEICGGEFSECTGLQMSMDAKTIREGGNNSRPIHLAGKVSYGKLSLKRGMTNNFDLWTWFEKTIADPGLRASGEVMMLPSIANSKKEIVKFEIGGCLPVKISAPSLNAQSGQHAIEEMQISYEILKMVPNKDKN